MSNASNFYVTLPSTGSKRFYPLNNASVFRNQLAEPIELDGQWEVALVEIQYPLTWRIFSGKNRLGFLFGRNDHFGAAEFLRSEALFAVRQITGARARQTTIEELLADSRINHLRTFKHILRSEVLDGDGEINYLDFQEKPDSVLVFAFPPDKEYEETTWDYVTIDLPHLYVNSPDDLAQTIVDLVNKKVTPIKVNGEWQNALSVKVEGDLTKFSLDSSMVSAAMVRYQDETSNLTHVMGWGKLKQFRPDLPHIAIRQVQIDEFPLRLVSPRPFMKSKTPALYIYTDIINDELVGDAKVPLLRSVPICGEMGEYASKEFLRPYYKPVSTGYITSILIEIKDDTGQDVEFTEGKVMCRLHFRRCALPV